MVLEAAIAYAAMDLHVIPVQALVDGDCTCPADSPTRKEHAAAPACKSPGKHPAIKGWERKASIDQRVLEQWFGGEPRNIGIVCGPSGIIVIDVDPRNGGTETLAALIERFGPLPPTATADTGGGGEHYLFRAVPADLDSKLGKGVDLQRGPRQIVVAPSVHPSGRAYQWRTGLAPGDVAIAELPDAWLEYATRKPAAARPITYQTHDHERQAKRAIAYVERMPASVQGDNGSGKLYTAACRVMHGFTLDDGTVKSILCSHFNPRCDPPWSERELDHVIDSARKHRDPAQWHVADDVSKQRAKRAASPVRSAASVASTANDNDGQLGLRHAGLRGDGGYQCTDAGNGRRFADMHANRLRYVKAWNQWVSWDGRRWRRDNSGAAERAGKEVRAQIYMDAAQIGASAAAAINAGGAVGPTRADALWKWADKSSSHARLEAMLNEAKSEAEIAATATEFDRDPWLFNVRNGTIDLRDGELRPHRQGDMITMLADVDYDVTAACPEFTAFLERVIPDPEVRDWTQRYLGYCLTGLVTEQKFAFWVGKGGNGKNVCADVVIAVLGEYAMVGAPDLLLEKHGEAHPTELADIEGKRLVVCSEIEPGRSWAEARIKQITGDKTIKARKMKQDFYEFAASGKLVVLANTKPKVRSRDNGLWRRMCLQPWTVQIPAHEQDKQLLTRLIEAERPGVLAWLVRGCLAWQRLGLGEPRAVTLATSEYRQSEDVLGMWIEDCCRIDPAAWQETTKLYESYKTWCKEAGNDRPWSLKAWAGELSERAGVAVHRMAAARGFAGIRLLGPGEL